MLFFIDKEFDKKLNLFIFHFGSGQIDVINHSGKHEVTNSLLLLLSLLTVVFNKKYRYPVFSVFQNTGIMLFGNYRWYHRYYKNG